MPLRATLLCALILGFAAPASAALTPAWQVVVSSATEDAYMVLDATGRPRVLFRTLSGAWGYTAYTSGGEVLATGYLGSIFGDSLNRRVFQAAPDPVGGGVACGWSHALPVVGFIPDTDAYIARFSDVASPTWAHSLDLGSGFCGLQAYTDCASNATSVFALGTASPPVLPPTPSCPFLPSNFGGFVTRWDVSSGSFGGQKQFRPSFGDATYTAIATSATAVYLGGTRGGSGVLDRYDENLNLVWSATLPPSESLKAIVAPSSGPVVVLAARVYRFTPEGAFVSASAPVHMAETDALAVATNGTAYVGGRSSGANSRAALASVAPDGVVIEEYKDATETHAIKSVAAHGGAVYATLERTGSIVHLMKFSSSGTASGNLSIKEDTDHQIVEVGTALTLPLTALIRDASSAPASGVTATFSVVPGSGGVVSQLSPASGPNGEIQANFTLGTLPLEYKIDCACPTCGPSGSSVTFRACGKLPVPDMNQGDSPWADDPYDDWCRVAVSSKGVTCDTSNPPVGAVAYKIRSKGCALSAMADVINYYRDNYGLSYASTTPRDLNQYLRDNSSYREGNVRFDDVEDYSVGQSRRLCYQGRRDLSDTPHQTLLEQIDRDLERGNPVILRVTSTSNPAHFVVAIGKCGAVYLVSDPGSDRSRIPAGQITGIRQFHLSTGSSCP